MPNKGVVSDDSRPKALAGLPNSRRDGSLADRAYQVIEEKIVTNEFPPSTILSESALAELLKIGRTPVREALQRLANEGLIQILPQRGILVSDINVDNYLRLMEARRSLDMLVAEMASVRASEKQRKKIADLSVQFRRAQSASNERLFMKIDREFNSLLAESADNPYLSRIAGLLQGQSRRFYFRHHQMADFGEIAELHARMASAVAAGDREAARLAADCIIAFNIRLARAVLLSGL